MRNQWLDVRFWPWWWRNRATAGTKLGVAIAVLGITGLAGYAASAHLTSGDAAPLAGGKTVQRVVTVRRHGTVAYVVRTTSRTVAGPGGTLVTTRVVRVEGPASVVRGQVVTRNGRTRTVVRTAPGAPPVTRRQTVTNDRQVTVDQPVTQVETRAVTSTVPVTVQRTQTQTVTQTETQTVTVTDTVTETRTVTTGTTITVTLPGP